ncbi:hypothetical protein KKF84_10450 [Myxococcota bacterium]|nr:hypothetical protein [Myxococcota bacterium]
MNKHGNRDPWDTLLFKTMKTRTPSRAPLGAEELLLIALGKMTPPGELDPGERDLLELMKEVVAETEVTSPAGETGFFQFIALAVDSSIRALASTLQFSSAQFEPVRSGGVQNAIEGKTAYGTKVIIAGSVRGNPEIRLSWEKQVPTRVIMKRDGSMVESAPVEGGAVMFVLKEAGIYSFAAKSGADVVEQITISVAQ